MYTFSKIREILHLLQKYHLEIIKYLSTSYGFSRWSETELQLKHVLTLYIVQSPTNALFIKLRKLKFT